MSYPSVYRAKAIQLTDNRLTVLVPQVFGESPIEVTHFMAPPVTGMGWVFFQAGNPEFPVWMTRLVGDGTMPDYSEEISDLQAEDELLRAEDAAIDARLDGLEAGGVALDARLDVLEAGGGAGDDEVWIGPSAPIGTQELWYDTDAPNPPSGTGVFYAKVAGSWKPIAISGTVISPAYAGLVSDSPTWARFGNVNHSGGMGEPGYRIDPTGEMQIAFGSGKALGVYEAVAPSWNPVISVTGGTVRINKRIESGVAAGSEAVSFTNGNYLAWWNGGTRLGYLQYNVGDVIVNAEGRQLRLHGNGIELETRGNNVTISGNSSVYWGSWGGGWYMQDGSWMRTSNEKNIWAGGGLIASMGQHIVGGSGAHGDGRCGFYAAQREVIAELNVGAGYQDWGAMQFRAVSNWGGNQGIAGIAFNPANAGVAPILWCYGGGGELFGCMNNQGSGYVGIAASGFHVNSTLRAKHDVTPFSDEGVLHKAVQVQGIRFKRNVRPQTLGPIDAPAHEQISHDHDCSIDPCNGTADDPCCIALNDTSVYGFAAEELALVLPEVVNLDPDRLPETVDIAQVACLALAAVGALTRKVQRLEEQIR